MIVWGSANHSPHWIATKLKKSKVVFAPKEGEVIFFNGVMDFVKHRDLYEEVAGVGVIFDNAVLLSELKGLKCLDYEQTLSYKFKGIPPNLADLRKDLKNDEPNEINIQKENVLAKVIETHQLVGFIDKYITFVHSFTNHTNRREVENLTLRMLFGDIDLQTYETAVLHHMPRRSKKDPLGLFKEMMDYLTAKRGKKLLAALGKINTLKQAGKTPQYKVIAKESDSSAYELKYLSLRYSKQLPDKAKAQPNSKVTTKVSKGDVTNGKRRRADDRGSTTPKPKPGKTKSDKPKPKPGKSDGKPTGKKPPLRKKKGK